MSPRDWKYLVDDILDAIDKIRDYVADMPFEEFEDDFKTIDAVVRNFTIIGEAASHMPANILKEYSELPWRLMTDMRNFAVHHYWSVDASVLWKTIQDDLPQLVPLLNKIKSTIK